MALNQLTLFFRENLIFIIGQTLYPRDLQDLEYTSSKDELITVYHQIPLLDVAHCKKPYSSWLASEG